ncbi:hypothetical protein BCR39DRAFT_588020 [Naematelia encephala]|uniref:Uncharacterized protein n=1 Tax=Naematelia encephala TaxID=71784 RepID=A0A1Y2B5Y6_9TREE|nr:hypothetical protein BCR39DRAFT_588020 [Naematelia encephala]
MYLNNTAISPSFGLACYINHCLLPHIIQLTPSTTTHTLHIPQLSVRSSTHTLYIMSSRFNSQTYSPKSMSNPTLLEDRTGHKSTPSRKASRHSHTRFYGPTSSTAPSRHRQDGTSHTGGGKSGPSHHSNIRSYISPSSSDRMHEYGTSPTGSGNTRSSRQGNTHGYRGTSSQIESSRLRQQFSATVKTPTNVSQHGSPATALRDDAPADLKWVQEVKARAIKTLRAAATERKNIAIETLGETALDRQEWMCRTLVS